MSSSFPTISLKEKIGYGLGDVATNFFFQSMILYQNRFYTDTVGLDPSVVGWMFLIVRLADAVFDPIIGALSDRTTSRWGKFRPWILFTAIPFGLAFWAVYVSPNFSPQGKLIYAYATYILVMALYSANNTPYSALMGVMTPDVSERSNIARYRFVSAIFGQFLIQALALPLVDKLGAGDSAKGWALTMGIFGVAIVVCNFIVFATTKERVPANPAQKPNLKEDIKNVFGCKPWLALFILTLTVFTMLVIRGSSLNYLFAYYMDQASITAFLGKIGLPIAATQEAANAGVLGSLGLILKPDGTNAVSVGLAFFSVVGSVVQILFIPLSKPLSDRFGKKTVFLIGGTITALATAAVYFVGPTSMNEMFWLTVLWGVGWGPTIPLLWLMIADVADYSEWQTSRRATGFMYAGILFALKVGLGLGGAAAGWIMGMYGYVANTAQTERAMLGIRLGSSIYPAIALGIALACLALYPISKELTLRIQNELEERRKKFTTA